MTRISGEAPLWEMREPVESDFTHVMEIEKNLKGPPEFQGKTKKSKVAFDGKLSNTADFVWYHGGTDAIISEKIADTIRRKFPCIDFEDVEIVTKRGKPYQKFEKSDHCFKRITIKHYLAMDWLLTTYREEDGVKSIYGFESRDFPNELRNGEPVIEKIPRVPGQGMYVRHENLLGCNFFGIRDRQPFYFCTDGFKGFIEDNGFTNVEFREMGGIVQIQ